jgi:hypothetical protein
MPRAAISSGSDNVGDAPLRWPASALVGATVALLAAAAPFGFAFEDSDDPTRLYAIFGLLFAAGTILLAIVVVLVYRQLRERTRGLALAGTTLALIGLALGGGWAHGYAVVGLPPMVLGSILSGVALWRRAFSALLLAIVVPAAAVAFLATDTDWASLIYTLSIPAGYGWALLELQRR